jgi:hypothetical protein
VFGRETLKEFMRGEQEKTLRALEETREFNREILLRNEKVYTSVIADLERMGNRLEAGRREMEEWRKQIRANTEAVLRLLDRFDDGGGATA